ncbi:ATP-binding protein [Pontibacter silvestris]|uniref:histidine kinase n=1 Tax=Pontibacter silvestris TaxID=2305183 RepID=A0ABW4WZR2_9BACT|nr:sensor histidine kinase [Pontibacter silvestris]MCC9137459.1 sensor histidine kinase [Pontibacter silvestris]
MQRTILKISINNELDVVLAYKRAMQLAERLSIAVGNQTKFATAVSEICRNVIEHVGNGNIQFNIVEDNGIKYLEALISDRGRGIGNIDYILSRPHYNTGGKGSGIINSKKLVDSFNIESEYEKGTRVTLRRKIPATAPILSKPILDEWIREFEQEADISPYAEIKKQNMKLLDLLEELRLRNLEADQQLQEIRRLNMQLQQSNHEISDLLEEREKKNNQLQKINTDLDAFAHTVSHDLRAPLQNINGITTVLEACLEANDLAEANNVFPLLRQQTYKMERLITGILAYSLAGHHNNIPKHVVDVQVLLHQVITSLSIPASFTIKLQPELPTLYTQEVYLYQVFSNIIGNAIKYHDQPEQAIIEIKCTLKTSWLEFSVQDNGPGVSKELQQQIFDMYEMGDIISRPDSSGLGLSIIKKIVMEKGGKVWVNSEGRGSKFNFTWPAAELIAEQQP